MCFIDCFIYIYIYIYVGKCKALVKNPVKKSFYGEKKKKKSGEMNSNMTILTIKCTTNYHL